MCGVITLDQRPLLLGREASLKRWLAPLTVPGENVSGRDLKRGGRQAGRASAGRVALLRRPVRPDQREQWRRGLRRHRHDLDPGASYPGARLDEAAERDRFGGANRVNSGNSPAPVFPLLNSVTSAPALSASSTIARPTNEVPPRTRIRTVADTTAGRRSAQPGDRRQQRGLAVIRTTRNKLRASLLCSHEFK